MPIYENIFDAVLNGAVEDVMYFIKEKNVNIDVKDKNGQTPLFLSAMHGNIDVFTALVKAGADVYSKAYDGRTILDTAELNGHAKIVKFLTKGKRDISDDDLKKAMKASERGFKYCMDNDLYNGINEFTEAIRLDPNNAAHYLNRGMIHVQTGQQPENGIEDLTEAIKLDPNNAVSYRTRGIALIMLNKIEQGINDLSEAVKIDPNDYITYMSRGTAYKQLKQYDKAKLDLEKVLSLNPPYKEILFEANKLLLEMA